MPMRWSFLILLMGTAAGVYAQGYSPESLLLKFEKMWIAAGASLQDDRKALVDLAQNRGARISLRWEAIKKLRTYAGQDQEIFQTLTTLACDERETAAIRKRSLQSLGYVVGQPSSIFQDDAVEFLTGRLENEKSKDAQVMAYKALHWATTDRRFKTRDLMLARAKDKSLDPDLRVAALWALGSVSSWEDVHPILKQVAQGERENPQVRAQALKSLYPLSLRRDLWELALKEARRADGDLRLREAAILFLFASKEREPEVQKTLEELKNDEQPRIREAARRASEVGMWPHWEIQIYFRSRAARHPTTRVPLEVLELEE